jgi:hypothetical protein
MRQKGCEVITGGTASCDGLETGMFCLCFGTMEF